jgi:hypothetical protein
MLSYRTDKNVKKEKPISFWKLSNLHMWRKSFLTVNVFKISCELLESSNTFKHANAVFALSQVYFHYQRCRESLIRMLVDWCNARRCNWLREKKIENSMHCDARNGYQIALRSTMLEWLKSCSDWTRRSI